MSVFSLIPFGFSEAKDELVDVTEVTRGRKCGCICPSCKLPLIAKQGSVKEWHFAHASMGVDEESKTPCDYSFWTSVHIMAKQILASLESIDTPSYIKYHDNQEIHLAKEGRVSLNSIALEKSVDEQFFDGLVDFQRYQIGILFTTPQKNTPVAANIRSTNPNLAVLEISLHEARVFLFKKEGAYDYKRQLTEFIKTNIKSKRWLYHPREPQIEQKHGITLVDTPRQLTYVEPERRAKYGHYECLNCNTKRHGSQHCDTCGTHLYSREL